GVNLPPLQGEGWGGDGVLRGILPPIPLPASPLKGEEICVPTGPEWLRPLNALMCMNHHTLSHAPTRHFARQ
ncbi:MAG: hypothetical protein Q8O31_04325, partial [Rhodocyclaceae bacterium]|nr:hypothetical protein [Rhodocyclaceae bacterium]